MNYIEICTKIQLFVTFEQLSTAKISFTYRTEVNYISKHAGDLREKSHEVSARNSNWSRRTSKKLTGGGQNGPPPMGLGLRKIILIVITN